MSLSRRSLSVGVLAGGLLAACNVTDVDPLTVSLRIPTFATQQERAAWPWLAPTVEGGDALVVRGWALTGCGRPEAHVERRDNVVGVDIRAVQTEQPCLGILSSEPVEATVSGLAPGVYRVRMRMAGLPQRTEGTATITAR